ncbi:MAG: TrkA C-terminal domain-containing protein, partial [Clostridium sp.]
LMHVFDTVTGIAQMMIFFLLGLLATPSELPAVLLPAALIMLFMTVIARPAAAAAILLPFRSHIRQIGVVSWAGLRGAASIVFAIMAVLSKVPMHYNLYNLVFCVVLLSIAVQGTFLPLVSEKLRMIDRNMDVRRTFNDYEEENSIHFVKTHIQEGHLFCGKRVRDISLPPEMLIVMILRGEEKRIPNGDTLLLAGDLLILAAPEFTEGENLILRERTTVRGDKWTGKTLKEVPLSKGTLVVSVRRGEETLIPTGNTRIQEGDILIIAKY